VLIPVYATFSQCNICSEYARINTELYTFNSRTQVDYNLLRNAQDHCVIFSKIKFTSWFVNFLFDFYISHIGVFTYKKKANYDSFR
jgi:hypothetical protein